MKDTAPFSSIALPKGATVLIRVDFNVGVRGGSIENDFRITQTLPTIHSALRRGYRVILLTHMEKDGAHPPLRVLASHLRKYHALRSLQFIPGTARQNIRTRVQAGNTLVLLENTRRFKGEEKDSAELARFFASLGSAFIHDAFASAHRKHASTHRITGLLPSYSGLLFEQEVRELSALFRPPRPFLLIVGGKKVSTKIPLLRKFYRKADKIFIGGAAANVLLRERGFSVGKSFVDQDAPRSFARAVRNARRILLPDDVVVQRRGSAHTVAAEHIASNDTIVDIGPHAAQTLRAAVLQSKCVLWNGPLGITEDGFDAGTTILASALRQTEAKTVVGGGDTIVFLQNKKLLRGFDFISTGGGAMLDFLACGTLPAIAALQKSKKKFHL